ALRTRFERAFAIGLGALLLALALAAQLLQPSQSTPAGSVSSSAPEGRRALLLLLRESGFRADAWNEAPGALPRGGALLWLARAPARAGDGGGESKPAEKQGEKSAEEQGEKPAAEERKVPRAPSPADTGLRADAHYRRFVEDGGVLVLPEGKVARAFLVDRLGFEDCGDVEAEDQ